MGRTAVVLFNLGGPDKPSSVKPFLRNLFSDPSILRVPAPVRFVLGRYIAHRRAPVAREIYRQIGGASPILEQTLQQASALEARIGDSNTRVFVCMRYWHPMSDAVAHDVRAFGPDHVILLPLYPQFSTSTTASSVRDWHIAAGRAGIAGKTTEICCYPTAPGFIDAIVAQVNSARGRLSTGVRQRIIFSAHGVPKSFVDQGDPYQTQIEATVAAVVARLGIANLDFVTAYQSRVGRLAWIQPYTDDEIKRAGRDGVSLVMVPVAFVSEHSETLVELDIEYAALARDQGVPEYVRAGTVGPAPAFIDALAELVRRAEGAALRTVAATATRICPAGFAACPLPLSALSEAR